MKIEDIQSYQVINSRGMPSLEVVFKIEGQNAVVIKAPQGASCGWEEPLDLIDNNLSDWSGKSVEKAKQRVSLFKNMLIGKSFNNPLEFDSFLLDNGLDVSCEVNVSLGLSFGFGLSYVYTNFSPVNQKYYPKTMLNFMNGGAHAPGSLSIQEIMLLPMKDKPSENLKMGHSVYQNLKKYLKNNKLSTAVGDEGGFVLKEYNTHQALDLFEKVCLQSGLKKGIDYQFSLDCAANEYFDKKSGVYTVDGVIFTAEDYRQWLLELAEYYPIYSIEDPFAETDHESYAEFMNKKDSDLVVIGDDLITSNSKKLAHCIDNNLVNGLILKPNQNGLFSDFEKTVRMAQSNGIHTVFSHRSGDTEDHWLTDLALYFNGDYLKAGALARSERLAKYNQLLRVEQAQ